MKFSRILLLLFTFCFLTSKEILEEGNSLTETPITIDTINVPIPEANCTLVIENLKKLFREAYIYTDIKKNPPNKDYFETVDVIDELDKINVTNRNYYDFFRDIKRIIGKIKDGHLNIRAYQSPNGYYLQETGTCLPFMFKIKGENRENAKIYISKYDACFGMFDENVQRFVTEHENEVALAKINDLDPFD